MHTIKYKDFQDLVEKVFLEISKQHNTNINIQSPIEKTESKTYLREDLIDLFKISNSTLSDLNRKGKINPEKIGRRYVYSQGDYNSIKEYFRFKKDINARGKLKIKKDIDTRSEKLERVEAMEYLDISDATLTKFIKKGLIKPQKLGRKHFYLKSNLDEVKIFLNEYNWYSRNEYNRNR